MEFAAKSYETDVLVLGSSAAGCGAAIAARKAGVDVLLVDKGVLESSGNLGGGNDHFMAVLDQDAVDSCEDMVKFFAKPITGLSPEIVRRYYQGMRPCLDELLEAGIELVRKPDGTYLRSAGFGQPGAWWIHINRGYTVKPKLARRVRKYGVRVVDNLIVTRLLKDGDRIAGCVGFDVLNGDFVTVRCKTAVLALGMTAQRVSNNSTHKPFNIWFSPYVTGSQVMLPLQVGASVLNLDITDMATLIPKSWGAPGMNGINNMGGKELNAKGERFMGKYDPMMENGIRRNQVMGTFTEMLEGNGPPFYMDMTHFSPEDAHHLQYELMPGDKETYLDYCRGRNIDFIQKPLEVEISERMIGALVKTDDNQETDVRNLFNACLVHTFSGAMCLGYTAGLSAAARAEDVSLPSLDQTVVENCRKHLYAPLENTAPSTITYTEFEDGLRQVMDYYVSYFRTGTSMECALNSLAVLEEYVPKLKACTLRELMRVRESLELFALCGIYIRACLQRKESGRAMYMRGDYPDPDPAFDTPLITRLHTDGLPVFAWS